MGSTSKDLMEFYEALLARYGPQDWWPGETDFEVMVGAVLTQNTNWKNVEKAIANLKAADLLTPPALDDLAERQLAEYIRPAGYFNIKAKRLKNLIRWLMDEFDGSLKPLRDYSIDRLREELLSINGIGRETADSIILYALHKPTFVVDTYTYRVLVRHGCIDAESDYELIKEFFESHLPEDVQLFNEFHALIVQVGKNHCKPRPLCADCPLEQFDHDKEPE
jgi:endonuclease III related protein